jgi:hypothetical protein
MKMLAVLSSGCHLSSLLAGLLQLDSPTDCTRGLFPALVSSMVGSQRAALALSGMDTVDINHPLFAGKMRIAMAGTVDSLEEKQWEKELQVWRVANTSALS